MHKPKVYTASKLSDVDIWLKLRREWKEIEFTSRWIDMTHLEADATPKDFERFWIIDAEDVRASDFVLVQANYNNEPLRGALVEAGIGIALGKTVIVVGEAKCYGSWQYHPSVVKVVDLTDARKVINFTTASTVYA